MMGWGNESAKLTEIKRHRKVEARLQAELRDARAENERLRPAPCVMTHTPPFDFAQCETHDETFPLGSKCRFDGTSPWEVFADEAHEQRVRAVRAEVEVERLNGVIAAMDDDADQALTEKAEAVEAESQAADLVVAEMRPMLAAERARADHNAAAVNENAAMIDDLRAKLAAAEADIERIIDALDEDWADNAEFEGWGGVEGMVRTVQNLCRRYSEENDRADAAERQLAAVRALAEPRGSAERRDPTIALGRMHAVREILALVSSEGGTE